MQLEPQLYAVITTGVPTYTNRGQQQAICYRDWTKNILGSLVLPSIVMVQKLNAHDVQYSAISGDPSIALKVLIVHPPTCFCHLAGKGWPQVTNTP